ncbi:MAG: hypothetical protein Q4E61_04145 [Alphaproteobacteria bacterium]|nr:hypothetical protein [Alphaproteobacteria bacterium]
MVFMKKLKPSGAPLSERELEIAAAQLEIGTKMHIGTAVESTT